jgi:hypothetical protein
MTVRVRATASALSLLCVVFAGSRPAIVAGKVRANHAPAVPVQIHSHSRGWRTIGC